MNNVFVYYFELSSKQNLANRISILKSRANNWNIKLYL